ncbi:ABC transporter ATP-binding protein [Aurantiacibacter gangjinensis]|uniref:Ferrichrome ABC transporter ATP-binding protein n=1 Tax=Aurantiacibacter gangjinensis TaxID=502682 RepID=A0A0G9MTF0_9SPHN|nr:ABC transporter ATP-binding protein [Aurantiacibacter gangjinensis]APE28367.1 Ferrichrome ABC transporter ATP-binding protein [Aurantiacibacter gangjinensis]KLE32598.1 ferrichrome ABC transporter ATP-binding protein [Aurantiacibacter gangjinensis]
MTLSATNLIIQGRLRDVSLTLHPGQITAICGPNGAGKSTLLSALAGLTGADKGEVHLRDEPLADIAPRRRAQAIGYLPQSGEVAWDVSVANLVALGRLPHGDRGADAIAAALAACDLDDLGDRPVSTLSGGEKARALLARVLAGQPQWLLADEPLAALDLAHQHSLLKVLRSQADSGVGVVLVVHDLAIAMNHADRVVVLHGGELAADRTPEDALCEAVIAQVWGVDAHWVGEPKARALVTHR